MTKQTIITIAVVATVLTTLFIAYQALVVVPKERIEAQTAIEERNRADALMAAARNKDNYDSCLLGAYTNYSSNWEQHCELLELEEDCSLPRATALLFEERKEKDEANCLAVYQANIK